MMTRVHLPGIFERGLLLCIKKIYGRSPFALDDDEVEAIRNEFMDLFSGLKGENNDLGFFEDFPLLTRDIDLRIVKMVEMGLIDVDEGAGDDPDGKPFKISEKGWTLVREELDDPALGRGVANTYQGPDAAARVPIFPPISPQITGAGWKGIGWRDLTYFYLLTFGKLTTSGFYDFLQWHLKVPDPDTYRRLFFKHVKPDIEARMAAGHLRVTEKAWCGGCNKTFDVSTTKQGEVYQRKWIDNTGREHVEGLASAKDAVRQECKRKCPAHAQPPLASVTEHVYTLTAAGEAFCSAELKRLFEDRAIKAYLKKVYEYCHAELKSRFYGHAAYYRRMAEP
ncbi:MAG: hypothetical protein JW839_04545 [Candidatus Lokiarchaeota archaeon]|nr:hypothetical protein [Candidatus Lokiarchaeota archaeon]